MKIKCIITDDEPFAVKGIKSYVEKVDYLELIGTCENALKLDAMLKLETPDLLFLDIEMPHITGLDYLASLKNPPLVIITSAYEKYALKGYELSVIDYLLKPISLDRFLKAVQKAFDYLQANTQNEIKADYFFIKTGQKIERISLAELVYVESMQNYVKVQTLTETHIAHLTLKKVIELLPSNQFVQTHKSYVLNIDKVKSIEGNEIATEKGTVPISKLWREAVLEKILQHKLWSRE
ncbi:response regulator [uncultured Imperialibacter sp.]|uniref:LytR/AlgR family response regulator transcription factor n=1 Tax=uncultured Imperialibacter sp. TaxID=1672639 RepID=UPI0030D7A193|tara:strand:- start:929 stop:1639 length:711 start_codon:yes stop_codon:yes gene_type:complete